MEKCAGLEAGNVNPSLTNLFRKQILHLMYPSVFRSLFHFLPFIIFSSKSGKNVYNHVFLQVKCAFPCCLRNRQLKDFTGGKDRMTDELWWGGRS